VYAGTGSLRGQTAGHRLFTPSTILQTATQDWHRFFHRRLPHRNRRRLEGDLDSINAQLPSNLETTCAIPAPSQFLPNSIVALLVDSSACQPTFCRGACVPSICVVLLSLGEMAWWRARGWMCAIIALAPLFLSLLPLPQPGNRYSVIASLLL
jgi:hypothetical protein